MKEFKVKTGTAFGADFEENTLEFKMDDPAVAKAGRFAIIEIKENADINTLSAAPEMLEALNDLVYTATKLWEQVSPIKSTESMTVTHPTIEQAKQAINKALGK